MLETLRGSRSALRAAALLALCGGLVLAADHADAKRKKKGDSGPKVGWQKEESWAGECYYPPDYASMAEGPRRVAWNEGREAVMSQWRGDRGDGVSLDSNHIENLETAILSKPERTTPVLKENVEMCEKVMSGKATNADWEKWVVDIAGRLTEGECPFPPLDYTYFNYLSVNDEWQLPVNVCKGDDILVHGTEADYYRLEKGGPWLNVAGDASQPASGKMPCNIEGCLKGQLIMRFTGESHTQQIIPIGITTEFVAPEHGRIEVMINDDTLEDNVFKVESGLEHHTGIEIKPAGE
ncbi:MAG: hypothetical protein R3F59_14010 [Myxococcota bacterium]